MAHISAWQTFALLPPARFPCGYFWDAEEIRHQEHLHRVSHAQFLYSHRTDSPEAMRVYKDFVSEQNVWMAEQEELIEREAQIAMKARMDRASRWAEEWRRLESGETVEEVLMKTGATLIMKSPFRQGDPVACVDTDPISLDDGSTPKRISTLSLPESLIDWKQSRSSCEGLQGFKLNCAPEHFPGSGLADGATATRIQSSGSDPAGITRELPQDPNRQILFKPLGQTNSHGSGVDTHPERNRFVIKPITSFPPGLGPPKTSRAENFATSGLPPAMTSLIQQGIGPAGGVVIKICSHKRRTDGGDLLYEILWKPHDLDIPPLKLWVKSGDFIVANKRVILDEYHLRNKLGIVHWRSRLNKKLRTSGSLGVKEIKDALDERKRSLVVRGRYDDRAAEFLGKCRWVMRGEWQQRGRGWAAGIEVTERWKRAWQDVDEAERKIGHNLEREEPSEAVVNAGGNDIFCLKEVGSRGVSALAVVRACGSSSFEQLDAGHVINPARDSQRILRDNHKITRKDEEEWRSFFGGLDPVIVDATDSSTIGGISEPRGVTGTSLKAVSTWRIGRSESLTPDARNINKTKGEFINLLRQDRFTRKSRSEATSAPVSVQSVSEAGSYLMHEQETFFSRLFIKDGHRNNPVDAADTVIYKPILQPSQVTETSGGFSRTSAIASTPRDGETSEGHQKSGNGTPQLNCTTTQEEVRRSEARTQNFISGGPRGTITRDVAVQASPSTKPLAGSRAGQSEIASQGTKAIGKQLDDDWRVRPPGPPTHTPGLTNLLAGARAYSGDCGSTQAAEYVHSPVASFRGDVVRISSLDGEEATEEDLGGNTEHRKESGSSHKKPERELELGSNRDRNPPQSVAFPQEALLSQGGVPQDGVSLLLTEVWLVQEAALAKYELAVRTLNENCERTKARGKELRSKKKEEGLTREEHREYKKLKKLLVRYRATKWFLSKIGVLLGHHRPQPRISRALPGLCGIS